MFFVRVYEKENILYARLSGRAVYTDMLRYTENLKEKSSSLKSGFLMIHDIQGFIPNVHTFSTLNGKQLMIDAMRFLKNHGLSRVIRIIDNRASKVSALVMKECSNAVGYESITLSKDEFENRKKFLFKKRKK